jgi:hypothetical protein
MKSDFAFFMIGVLLGILFSIVIRLSIGDTYKDGQIDAINGKIYYELQLQEDGTTDWVFVNDE